MRLLETKTGQFVEKEPKSMKYAVLSHTWDTEKGEQTYEELKKIQQRYVTPSQTSRSRPGGPTSSVPISQFPNDSSSTSMMARPLIARELLTQLQSEVDAVLRAFIETHGLAVPIPAPSSNDPSTPSPEHQPPSTPRSIWDDPDLSPKIRDACKVARENGHDYIWIDSCCIDKSSSSELSEAINTMYKWYGLADVCYAYLADVPPGESHRAEGSCFRESRWFTRGWTLQELIAPAHVVFLAKDWTPIESKHALCDLVESITKIHSNALLKLKPPRTFSVAQRLSWTAKRETTREEDSAYSLLGIFDINMPTLYGEGDRAFRRLQEQVMQRIPDQSLFAWGPVHLPSSQVPPVLGPGQMFALIAQNIIALFKDCLDPIPLSATVSLFVQSPHGFKNSESIRCVQLPPSLRYEIKYTFTPLGIRTKFQMISFTQDLILSMFPPYSDLALALLACDRPPWYLAILGCEHNQHPGHLLGRLCHILPSESNVEFVYTDPAPYNWTRRKVEINLPHLIPLSPETIERCRPQTELKTVYILHPQSDHIDQDSLRSLRRQPYVAIKLVLLTETRDTLHSRGYSANLRHPDPDHPTTHWLTLSKAEHTITLEFRHTLENGGKKFTMDVEVKLSGSGVQLDSAPDSDHVDHWHRTVSESCGDSIAWFQTVLLGSARVGGFTVNLSLRFLGTGVYSVDVNVHSDTPPPAPPDMPVVKSAPPPVPSAVESATERAALREIGDGSPSGVVTTEDEAGQEEAGGCETASADTRDRRDSASDGAGSEEVGGGLI